ncbi:MAG TPA: DUF302 domain-containing protein [Gammaproteobacteria bacterium]|nr:DUF302 domain-containing protein [Gammaproteobacteria bacterium]
MKRLLLALVLWAGVAVVQAQDLYMVRSEQPFPETMGALQKAIADQGYKLSRVQRVDIGLTRSGFKTDRYRVVFFGKADEIRQLAARYPDLVAYLPLKIAIFAEGEQTLMLASSFRHLRTYFDQPELQAHFDRWERDIQAILQQAFASD